MMQGRKIFPALLIFRPQVEPPWRLKNTPRPPPRHPKPTSGKLPSLRHPASRPVNLPQKIRVAPGASPLPRPPPSPLLQPPLHPLPNPPLQRPPIIPLQHLSIIPATPPPSRTPLLRDLLPRSLEVLRPAYPCPRSFRTLQTVLQRPRPIPWPRSSPRIKSPVYGPNGRTTSRISRLPSNWRS